MSNSTKQRTTINIMGVDYHVIAEDDPKRVKMIASFVDKLIKETKSSAPFMTNMSATVLSALNLSEELYRIKDELEQAREKEIEYELLTSYKDKLTTAMSEIESNEAKNNVLQSRLERAMLENEELNEMLDEYKEKFNSLRAEYEINKRTLTDLQNKFLENQIELVKARKTLLDFND